MVLEIKLKVLFVANIHKHFSAFHIPYINWLKSQGFEVHVAANDGSTRINEADKQFDIPINRNPLSFDNVRAIKQLKGIIKNEHYALVHCHTAMGSVTARLAAISFRKQGLKVIYTAHGFHFFKGSSKKFWLLYFPIEKYLSRFTDAIITINKEDYNLVKQFNFKNKSTFLISGVGVEAEKFNPVSEQVKQSLRSKNNIDKNAFVLVYAAEYIHRKNHEFLIECVKRLHTQIPHLKVLLAGRGQLMESIGQIIISEGLQHQIIQLGFRSDIDEIYKLSDVGISTSRQEGLGLNLVEEMMCGLPAVATKDRGHNEIIDHHINGFIVPQNNTKKFSDAILELYNHKYLYNNMSKEALNKAKKFKMSDSMLQMQSIYKQFLDV
jgi:glycosyltransferase EpsD